MSTNEKSPRDPRGSAGSSDSSDHAGSTRAVDSAWRFLNDHRETGDDVSSVDLNALRRRIDWRIVPLMFSCYTMQFLDKVILNVSLPLTPGFDVLPSRARTES